MTLDDTEIARGHLYRLLSATLARRPDAAILTVLAGLAGGDGPIGVSLNDLAAAAGLMTEADARREYDALFIGITEGEVVPYASFYLTGFLYERPLARLREDMAAIGLARADGRTDPEDHIATVCEAMASLIDGSACPRQPVARQAAFFRRHLDAWAGRFFGDLAAAPSARLYRPLGELGRAFIELETEAFLLECA
jgi:TorA maturation chaperone TorD